MDYPRSREERESRGNGRNGHNRDRPRYSRDHSPPLNIPLRHPSQSGQSIPLRPAHPQRFPDYPSASNSSQSYYRQDSSLPPRPSQRYRSPPPGASTATPARTWEPRPRERETPRGWTRDEFSSSRAPERRPSGYRESEPTWAERENRDRRPYQDPGTSRGFDIPYRSRAAPRKRSRESSEDEEAYGGVRSRSRGGSAGAEWRSRNGSISGRVNGDRRDVDSRSSKGPPLQPARNEERSRRPPSPAISDKSAYDYRERRIEAEANERRSKPRRSYSPGEISEGHRSPSPISRSESPSAPPQERSRSRSQTKTPPISRQHSGTPPHLPPDSHPPTDSWNRPTNDIATYAPRRGDSPEQFVVQRSDPIRPPRPTDRPATSPPRPTTDSPATTLFRVPDRILESRRASTPPSSPRRHEHSSHSLPPRVDSSTAASPTHGSRPPLVEVGDARHTNQAKPTESPRLVKLCNLPPSTDSTATAVTAPHPPLPSPHPSPPASPRQIVHPSDTPPHDSMPYSPRRPPYDPPPASKQSPISTILLPVHSPPPSPNSLPPAVETDTHTVDSPLATTLQDSRMDDLPSTIASSTNFDISNQDPLSLGMGIMDDAKATMEREEGGDARMEVDDATPNRSPSPAIRSESAPLSPPRDFDSILGSIISANEVDLGEVNMLMESNRLRTEKERTSATALQDLTRLDVLNYSQQSHDRLLPFLQEGFAVRDVRRGEQIVQLRHQYKLINDDWKAHCRRLDRVKDRIHRRNQPTTPSTPFIDPSGLPVYPDPAPLGQSLNVGRANRRNNNASYGYGDAVRSEAEFLEILASLETADMRDPNVRATRTAAVVPDMVVDDSERRELLALEDTRRLVVDPVDFYSLGAPLDLWTEEEVQIFCKRFSQHPKQFGRIAADLSEKSTAQCVLFYYRMKTTIDFRSLSDRRSGDGRRRKTRRRVDSEGNAKKGASLLSNLKRVRADDRDEDEDSPPPSPQARPKYIGDSPSVYQLPGSTSRPAPPPDDIEMNDDDSRGPPSRPTNKKGRHLLAASSNNPPSDGMLEAAEVLGGLAGFGMLEGDEYDDSEGKPKKRKGDYDSLEKEKSAAARRKSASSSYWSVAERNEFIRMLGVYGKDWSRLAEGLDSKTAVQCRNWFQNHSKKLNLNEIAKNAGGQFAEDGEDDVGSGAVTPASEYLAPLGVPLRESFGPNGTATPQAGFFVPDTTHRIVSPQPSANSPLPAFDSVFAAQDAPSTTKSSVRNLLNVDSPDEKAVEPVGNDWFGGGGLESNGAAADEGSITTEDEGEYSRKAAREPRDAGKEYERSRQQRSEHYSLPSSFPLTRLVNGGGHESAPPAPPSFRERPAYHYASNSFDSPSARAPAFSNHWQSSPFSHPLPYAPPGSTSLPPSRPSTATRNDADFFRRSVDLNGSSNAIGGRTTFGAQRASFSGPKPNFSNNSSRHNSFSHPSNGPTANISHYPEMDPRNHRSNNNQWSTNSSKS